MPVTYRIDGPQKIIYTKCFGKVTLDEVGDHFRALVQDSECPDRLNVLLDLTEVTSIPESEQLRVASGQIGRIREKVQFQDCAVVVATDVLFGMARMFEVFAEEWFREISVFWTREEAEVWLTSYLRSPANGPPRRAGGSGTGQGISETGQ